MARPVNFSAGVCAETRFNAASLAVFSPAKPGKTSVSVLQIESRLLDLNIAGTRMHIQQDPAIPDFALDVVAGHRALHGERMIHLQRP